MRPARWPARAAHRPGNRGSRPGWTRSRPAPALAGQPRGLHGECRRVGLRGIEEVRRQVDDVVAAAVANRGHGPFARQADATDRSPTRATGPGRVASARSSTGSGSSTWRCAAPSARICAIRKPPEAPASSTLRMRDQPVWQRVQRGGGVADIERARLRQGGDAVAVAIQAKGLRRPGHAQHAGIVGDVGIDALGEVVQQQCNRRAVTARCADHVCIWRVQRRVDRLEVVEFCPIVEQQQRLGAEQRDSGRGGTRPAASVPPRSRRLPPAAPAAAAPGRTHAPRTSPPARAPRRRPHRSGRSHRPGRCGRRSARSSG